MLLKQPAAGNRSGLSLFSGPAHRFGLSSNATSPHGKLPSRSFASEGLELPFARALGIALGRGELEDYFVDGLNEALGAILAPRGFLLNRRYRWVDDEPGPIRKIFEFQLLKGATYSARWGFSLNFAPLLRNNRLQSKRTVKAAEFDLCIDPIDEFGSPPNLYSITCLSIPKDGELERVASMSAEAAHQDLARVASVCDLMAMFEERAQMTSRRFSLENYRQTQPCLGPWAHCDG
jgi:hypothetical protein